MRSVRVTSAPAKMGVVTDVAGCEICNDAEARSMAMNLERKDRGRIMACPAVRLSVEIRRPSRLLEFDGKRALVLGRPRCSDEEDCEFLEGPSCLLPMVREVPAVRPEP